MRPIYELNEDARTVKRLQLTEEQIDNIILKLRPLTPEQDREVVLFAIRELALNNNSSSVAYFISKLLKGD